MPKKYQVRAKPELKKDLKTENIQLDADAAKLREELRGFMEA
jgi:hypothetical protein